MPSFTFSYMCVSYCPRNSYGLVHYIFTDSEYHLCLRLCKASSVIQGEGKWLVVAQLLQKETEWRF